MLLLVDITQNTSDGRGAGCACLTDMEAHPVHNENHTPKGKKTAKSRVLKIIYIVAMVISILIIAAYCIWTFAIRPPVVDDPTLPLPPTSHTPAPGQESGNPDPTAAPSGPVRRDQVYTCLIFGMDDNGLTDTIMVATFDVPGEKIGLMSFPRDTVVRLDLAPANNKLNAAYGRGGVEEMDRELEELLGFPIDFYVKIRLSAFQRLVDSIGGVWFDVPFYMRYSDPTQNLYIDQPAGHRLLSGEDAMEVVRYRQDNFGNDGFGDVGRAGVQQALMKAMLSQLMANASLSTIPDLVDVLMNYVETDAGLNDMLYFGRALVGMDLDSAISTGTLPAVWSSPYMWVQEEEALDMINELLNPYDTEITADMVEFLKR